MWHNPRIHKAVFAKLGFVQTYLYLKGSFTSWSTNLQNKLFVTKSDFIKVTLNSGLGFFYFEKFHLIIIAVTKISTDIRRRRNHPDKTRLLQNAVTDAAGKPVTASYLQCQWRHADLLELLRGGRSFLWVMAHGWAVAPPATCSLSL